MQLLCWLVPRADSTVVVRRAGWLLLWERPAMRPAPEHLLLSAHDQTWAHQPSTQLLLEKTREPQHVKLHIIFGRGLL